MTPVIVPASMTKISIENADQLIDFMLGNGGIFRWRPNSFEGYDSDRVLNMLLYLERIDLVVKASDVLGHNVFNGDYIFILNDDASKSKVLRELT